MSGNWKRGVATEHTGETFGWLTVESRASNGQRGQARWNCRCRCGKLTVVDGGELRRGSSQSCGCMRREASGVFLPTHGQHGTPEHTAWCRMRDRCINPKASNYKNYGGRGIAVCERWLHSFENFLADMGKKPSLAHSLDRIDPDGNYEPMNCRWGTPEQQAQNRTNAVWIEWQGERLCRTEWSRRTGLTAASIAARLARGWLVEDALSTPKWAKQRDLATLSRGGRHKNAVLTNEQAEDLRCRWNAGEFSTKQAAADVFNVGVHVIYAVLSGKTYTDPTKPAPSIAPSAIGKLTQAQANAVREAFAAGKSKRELMAEYQVSYSTIHCIIIRRTYRGAPPDVTDGRGSEPHHDRGSGGEAREEHVDRVAPDPREDADPA